MFFVLFFLNAINTETTSISPSPRGCLKTASLAPDEPLSSRGHVFPQQPVLNRISRLDFNERLMIRPGFFALLCFWNMKSQFEGPVCLALLHPQDTPA